MEHFILYLVATVYFIVSATLFLYGLHCLGLLISSWFVRADRFKPQRKKWEAWPHVTVQIPIYNEMYVTQRIIDTVCALDYPSDRLQIQVLDDSTDETSDIARTAVNRHWLNGRDIQHIQRPQRTGYKAGALAHGTEQASGEFLAIFDADFIPPSDYLYRMMPYFKENIAFVQARWGHINPNTSLLTRMQAVLLDAHFTLEQTARSRLGLNFNFNGTAGIWRKTALQESGGWQADTLTEDVDLSYRAFLHGWKAAYINDVVVPAELPVSAQGFRRQQYRWARGSLECAAKLLPPIWRSSQSIGQKLAATFHLTGYTIHLLLFALILLYPILLNLEPDMPGLIALFNIAYLFAGTAIIPPIFFITGQIRTGQLVRGQLWRILFITSAGAGLMINTLSALIEILLRRHASFERTAKFGLQDPKEIPKQHKSWWQQQYHLKADHITIWEFVLSLIAYSTAIYALLLNHWGITFYAAVFGTGLFYLATLTFWQTWQINYAHKINPATSLKTTIPKALPPHD